MSDVRQKTVRLYQALEELIDQNGYGPKLVERRVLEKYGQKFYLLDNFQKLSHFRMVF